MDIRLDLAENGGDTPKVAIWMETGMVIHLNKVYLIFRQTCTHHTTERGVGKNGD